MTPASAPHTPHCLRPMSPGSFPPNTSKAQKHRLCLWATLSLDDFVLGPQTLSLVAEWPRPCYRLAHCYALSAELCPAHQLPVLIRQMA